MCSKVGVSLYWIAFWVWVCYLMIEGASNVMLKIQAKSNEDVQDGDV
jgi:hypothetical protein